jgi:DNA-binding FadR family transcriptional regulator
MQQFGVGRSSIREAVRILSNCGLVNVKQGLGTFVNLDEGLDEPLHQRLKRANPADLKEVRQLLEVKAAQKAAANRTQKDIAKLTSLLKKRMNAANKGETKACIDFDIQFHIAVAGASGNDILADLYSTIAVQIKQSFTDILEIHPGSSRNRNYMKIS